jgi:uncharacterized OsmC-like protein
MTSSDTHGERIAAALVRLHAAVATRPGFGHSTATSESVLGDGLQCATTEKSWRIDSDLGPALGGEGAAPSPTALVHAALGACLAMGYRLRAAECGIELTGVRVTVESESHVSGMLDPGAEVPPGYIALRCHVDIESPAPAPEVERLIELADALSPVLDMLTRAHTIERTVSTRQAG